MENIKEPFIFTGNYDSKVPAADIFRADGYTFYMWPNGAFADRSVGTADVVDADKGKVRFGDYALDFGYDYSSYNGASNANTYMRYCGKDITIDGTPKELGMWIYAPEGTPNFAMEVCVEHWNGSSYSTSNLPLFYKMKDKDTGEEKLMNTWNGKEQISL